MRSLLNFVRNPLVQIFGALLLVGIVLYILGLRMTKADLNISAAPEPITCLFGARASAEACASGIPLTNTLITTVIVDLLLLLTILFGARNMQLIPRGFQNIVEVMVEGFYNFALSVDRRNISKFFPYCATIFFFVLYANFFELLPGAGSIGLCVARAGGALPNIAPTIFTSWPGACALSQTMVPFLRPPSTDLNVTLAFGLISIILVEFFGFQALGWSYLTKFFNFREGPIGTFVGIMELLSEIIRIVSFAFRLFGNIFGGEVILIVMSFLFPYLLPLPFYGFEVFVSFIQAVIFSVLSLVFMSIATQAHEAHDEHGHDEGPVQIESDVPEGVAA